MRTFILIGAVMAAFASPAFADDLIPGAGDVENAFGMGWEGFETPISAGTRDANGNRVIVNGRMRIEGALSGGLMDNFATGIGSATAIGNQLNVITQGSYNTVIVNSTQINTGDISADIDGDE